MYMYMYVNVYVYVYVYVYYLHICIHVCVCVLICLIFTVDRMYGCGWIYIYIYMHTYPWHIDRAFRLNRYPNVRSRWTYSHGSHGSHGSRRELRDGLISLVQTIQQTFRSLMDGRFHRKMGDSIGVTHKNGAEFGSPHLFVLHTRCFWWEMLRTVCFLLCFLDA